MSFLRFASVALALVWVVYFSSTTQATPSAKVKQLRLQAEQLENQAHWGKACSLYAKCLEIQSNHPEIREHYFYCLRRYLQERRHSDPSFLKEVLSLDVSQSERLYEFILSYLTEHAFEAEKVTPKVLFQKGLEELDNALTSSVFLRAHLEKVPKAKVAEFRKSLSEEWKKKPVQTIAQAVNLVHKIATSARKQLKLSMTTTFLEFTCGSCYAVDDYTMYLTPAELRGLCNSVKGESVGVGIKLGVKGDKMIITDIATDSPAHNDLKPPLAKFDQVLSIDGKSTAKMFPEVAMDMLHGEPGTEVELEVFSPEHGTRIVRLPRRIIFVPSVKFELLSGQVGYIAITAFQASTVQELDAALAALNKMEIKALILDLRGNCGGIFNVALDVARRFLTTGIIASTQTHETGKVVHHIAQNNAALTLPLVVLVDGKTASAAEILAGALKENRRAKLVGLPTFGKGCIQEVYSISTNAGVVFPGGLRVTVTRFLSPNGTPYSGKGMEPHVLVEPDWMGKTDPQLQQAFDEAQRLMEESMMTMPDLKM